MARDPQKIREERDQAQRRLKELEDELAAATGQQPTETPRPGPTTPESIGPASRE